MAKRRPSKEIVSLIGPGTPTKQSKTSNYQEQPDAVSTLNPWSCTLGMGCTWHFFVGIFLHCNQNLSP